MNLYTSQTAVFVAPSAHFQKLKKTNFSEAKCRLETKIQFLQLQPDFDLSRNSEISIRPPSRSYLHYEFPD